MDMDTAVSVDVTVRERQNLIQHLIQELDRAARIFLCSAEHKRNNPLQFLVSRHDDRRDMQYSRAYKFQCRVARCFELRRLLREMQTDTSHDDSEIIYEARKQIALSKYPWLERRYPSMELMNEVTTDTTFVPFAENLNTKKNQLLDESVDILLLPDEVVTKLGALFFFDENGVKSMKVRHVAQYLTSSDTSGLGDEELCTVLFKLFLEGLIER